MPMIRWLSIELMTEWALPLINTVFRRHPDWEQGALELSISLVQRSRRKVDRGAQRRRDPQSFS
jgi:hypothetical protein